jgi:hypothetical protein
LVLTIWSVKMRQVRKSEVSHKAVNNWVGPFEVCLLFKNLADMNFTKEYDCYGHLVVKTISNAKNRLISVNYIGIITACSVRINNKF